MMTMRGLAGVCILSPFILVSCSGPMKMQMHPPQQGLYGTFITYGPVPEDQKRNCDPLKTQAEKDSCRHFNERTLEAPLQAIIRIRDLTADSSKSVELDSQGSYKVTLTPGSYEVCLGDECSDPLDVAMGTFVPYGGRLQKK